MSQAEATRMINGVDVAALAATIDAIKANRPLSKFQFRAHNRWLDCGHNRSEIQGFYGAGKEDDTRRQPFTYDNDEPSVLLGTDQAANPVEFLLHALAGCLTSTLAYHAAARGITIEAIESDLAGDIDIQGFLGLSNQVPRGYQTIRVTLRVRSKAPAAQLQELAQFSPVFNTITRPTQVAVQVVTDA